VWHSICMGDAAPSPCNRTSLMVVLWGCPLGQLFVPPWLQLHRPGIQLAAQTGCAGCTAVCTSLVRHQDSTATASWRAAPVFDHVARLVNAPCSTMMLPSTGTARTGHVSTHAVF
jgi:hypothetical protein